jgi:flagellar protein FliO/FliZ
VVRIADVVLVVGATEEQVTLLAEVDGEVVDSLLSERRGPMRLAPAQDGETAPAGAHAPALVGPRAGSGALAGSVFDRQGWGNLVHSMRERTVRRP